MRFEEPPLLSSTRSGIHLLLLLLGGCFLIQPQAAWPFSPTTPPDFVEPIPIAVRAYIINITDVDEFRNTFELEVEFESSWNDPRLAFSPGQGEPSKRVYGGQVAEQMLGTIWVPDLGAVNVVGRPERLKTMLSVEADGTAMYRIRASGVIKSHFDFRDFPFDDQVFELRIRPFFLTSDVIRLVESDEKTAFDPNFHLPEWEVRGVRTSIEEVTVAGMDRPYSQLTIMIDVTRKSGFYIWKVLLPILTIVCISWVVFWMTGEQLGRRASTSATTILTIIAYQFIMSGSLPRIPYLTVMDRIILWSFVTTSLSMVLNIVATQVSAKKYQAGIDRTARMVFPGVYFGVLLLIIFL